MSVRFFLCIARISVQTDTRAKGLSTFLLFLVALPVARIGDRGMGFACWCLLVFDVSRGRHTALSLPTARPIRSLFLFFLLWAPAEAVAQHVDLYMFPDPKAGNPAGQVNALVAYLNSNNIHQRTTPPRAYRVCVCACACVLVFVSDIWCLFS